MAQIGLKKENIDAIKFAFDVYELTNDGKVDAFYTGDLFNKYKLNSHLNDTKGKTNNVLKAIKLLIREIKINKLDIPQNIKTHVTKMPIPPLKNHPH